MLKKVQFKCKHGHTWETEFRERIRHKSGCPYCSGRYAIPGETDLYTWCKNNGDIGNKILRDWTGLNIKTNEIEDIHNVSRASRKELKWKCCICGNKWNSEVVTRTGMKTYCPYCNNHKVVEGFNDLYTWASKDGNDIGNELLKQWDYSRNEVEGIDIHKITKGSNLKIWLKCSKCGGIRQQRLTDFLRGAGCHLCNKKSTSYPEQFIYYAFKSIFKGTQNRPKLFKNMYDNKNGYEYDVYIPEINTCIEYSPTFWHSNKNEYDTFKKRICIENDVRFISIIEDSYNEMEHIISDDYICFKMIEHKKDEILQNLIIDIFKMLIIDYTKLNFRYIRYKALKNCSENVENDDNSIIKRYPQLENMYSIDNRIEIKNLTYGSKRKVTWVCKNFGSDFTCSPNQLTSQNKCCPTCGYSLIDGKIHPEAVKKAIEGKTDIKTMYPEIAKELIDDRYNACELLPGSNKKVMWKCSQCGHEWMTQVIHRIMHKSGCPNCKYNPLKANSSIKSYKKLFF